MIDIRNITNDWSEQTYRQALNGLHLANQERYADFLLRLGILDVPMDGFSCERLQKTEESRGGFDISYSNLFHEEIVADSFSPLKFLKELIDKSEEKGYDDTKILGILARGLRSMASLLREPVFADDLRMALHPFDNLVRTTLNAAQDSGDHTDVLLFYKGNCYRIWLYQFSPRGLPHDIERLTGKRGELPVGIHLTCPLHTELALPYIKLSKTRERLQQKEASCLLKIQECSERAVVTRENLQNRLSAIQSAFLENEMDLFEAAECMIQELEVLNGWFFYSSVYIERIVDFLNSNTTYQNYSKVVEELTIAERFVGSNQIFRKGQQDE